MERAAENGWVNGVGNGQFAPEKQISYAEMFTMLVRVYLPDEADGYQEIHSLIRSWYDPYFLVAFDYSFTDGLQFGYDVLRDEGDKRIMTRDVHIQIMMPTPPTPTPRPTVNKTIEPRGESHGALLFYPISIEYS